MILLKKHIQLIPYLSYDGSIWSRSIKYLDSPGLELSLNELTHVHTYYKNAEQKQYHRR
jgi:hypothetical protein